MRGQVGPEPGLEEEGGEPKVKQSKQIRSDHMWNPYEQIDRQTDTSETLLLPKRPVRVVNRMLAGTHITSRSALAYIYLYY